MSTWSTTWITPLLCITSEPDTHNVPPATVVSIARPLLVDNMWAARHVPRRDTGAVASEEESP